MLALPQLVFEPFHLVWGWSFVVAKQGWIRLPIFGLFEVSLDLSLTGIILCLAM
jgi:hypothetical protein